MSKALDETLLTSYHERPNRLWSNNTINFIYKKFKFLEFSKFLKSETNNLLSVATKNQIKRNFIPKRFS